MAALCVGPQQEAGEGPASTVTQLPIQVLLATTTGPQVPAVKSHLGGAGRGPGQGGWHTQSWAGPREKSPPHTHSTLTGCQGSGPEQGGGTCPPRGWQGQGEVTQAPSGGKALPDLSSLLLPQLTEQALSLMHTQA